MVRYLSKKNNGVVLKLGLNCLRIRLDHGTSYPRQILAPNKTAKPPSVKAYS